MYKQKRYSISIILETLSISDRFVKQNTDKTSCSGRGANVIRKGTSGNTRHTLDECKELCLSLTECTSINWAPGDGRCYALRACENPGVHSGWQHYLLEGKILNELLIRIFTVSKNLIDIILK